MCKKRNIIGYGTKRGKLHYVDEVIPAGHAMLAYGSTEQNLWIRQRCLKHPSLGYLNIFFNPLQYLKYLKMCGTCVLIEGATPADKVQCQKIVGKFINLSHIRQDIRNSLFFLILNKILHMLWE